MSPSGRESDSDVSSYLDGVPVKISERYRPPRKVVLPVGFQHRLGVTLENALRDTAYDFSLAHSVVEDSKTRREQRFAVRENRKARIAAEEERKQAERDRELADQIEKFTLQSDAQAVETETATSSLPSPPLSPPPALPAVAQTKAVTTQSQFSEILMPQPMPAPAKITSPTVPAKSVFNISDFEADTSSPFDNMELKTINEMEELAHVLQPNCVSDIRPKDNYQYSNYYPQSTTTSNNMPNTEQTNNKSVNNTYGVYGQVSTIQSGESHLNGPTYASNHQNYMFPTQNHHQMQHHQQQQQTQQQQSSSYYYPNQQTWMYAEQHSAYSYVPPQYNTQMNTTSKSYAYPPNNIPVYSQANAGLNYSHSTITDQIARSRTSKSVPDIMEELQREAAALSSPSRSTAVPVPKGDPLPIHTLPTPRPASFGSTGLENWKPWPELDSPAAPEDPSPPPVLTRAPANPITSLPAGTQQLARQLSEMGFPLARVARACETVGQDQKKVLDYLLQVQALEERGFPGSRVELAVGKLGLDEAKALKFLPALGQLIDLGFPEDRASQVLLQFDCDRDKALDALLA